MEPDVMTILDRMTGGPPQASDVRDTAGVVAFLLENPTQDPVNLMIATVRLIAAAAGSNFKRTLAPSIADWTGREWAKVVDSQVFALCNPRVTCPAILDAVRTSEGDLASAARIALACIPAVQIKLDAKSIQRTMGHSNIEITFNVYGHLMKDREGAYKSTAEALAREILGSSCAKSVPNER
jgi:hypothetical protein